MINYEAVESLVVIMGDYSNEQIQKYQPIIDNAICIVGNMTDENNYSDERIIYLAAARANYNIKLIEACGVSVSSFTAGEISISENNSTTDNSKQLLESAMLAAQDLISDDSFAFLGV